MIVSYDTLIEELEDAELAGVSLDFWSLHENLQEINFSEAVADPNHPIWAELRAFQFGWARCKRFYEIKD